MSYILDALKKTELEKNRKNTPSGRVGISGDLYSERKRPTSKTGIWKAIAIIAIASLAVGVAALFFMRGKDKKATSATCQISPLNKPTTIPAAAPSVPPVSPNISTPVSTVQQPAKSPVTVVKPAAITPPTPSVLNKNTEGSEDEDEIPSRRVRQPQKPIKAPAISLLPTVPTIQAPADIKLSGIAWQDQRSARRAVINGFLMKEGGTVSGAKISEIHPNRVRFISPSGQFDIKLDAVLPAELKR